ncbi:hypothetical protein EVAR_22090_1 [Eumeta japonica]|uniref:Uncharacterized protein n=1 Tax=Eumeta variegata TaxID=151549 RepID=A0A4C1UTX2_EUMVA|nr:hypothetical protein EVAR_22090_1 [Eumeta japonica]
MAALITFFAYDGGNLRRCRTTSSATSASSAIGDARPESFLRVCPAQGADLWVGLTLNGHNPPCSLRYCLDSSQARESYLNLRHLFAIARNNTRSRKTAT